MLVRILQRMILTALLAIAPTTSLAMTETVWDFRKEPMPRTSWRFSGIDRPEKTPDGLRIRAPSQDGSLLSDLLLNHPAEVVSVTFASQAERAAMFVWHRRKDPGEMLTQLGFIIPQGVARNDFNVDFYRQWDRHADTIGFIFPMGTDVLLQEIRFARWTLGEKAVEIWKSFWIFDDYNPFSINFLWGPLITFNPVGTSELFTTLPPMGRSGMWIFYASAAVAVLAILADRFWNKARSPTRTLDLPPRTGGRRMKRFAIFFLCYGALWVIFDVRMGAEMLSYVKDDYDAYLSKPHGERTFRTYLNFNDVMEVTVPWLDGVREFALLRGATPVSAMTRYFALPAVTVEPAGPRPDLPVWLVYHRDDTAVDGAGRLTVGGAPWTSPGRIVQRFDSRSFLFRTNP